MNNFFSGELFICYNRKFATQFSFCNNILHKLAKPISHRKKKKSPEAGGYSFTTYKLAMMPRGETSLPHDTCHKTCRETMLHWHVEGKGLTWPAAETVVVVVFFFVLVGWFCGWQQARCIRMRSEGREKKKSLELVLSKRRILQKFGTWVC
jgi:hypothetical protein